MNPEIHLKGKVMIHQTTDYEIFKIHEENRKINNFALQRLKNSILAHNLLHSKPIIVDKNMVVFDGQHRLQAAKELKMPIYYVIDENINDEDMILLNANQKNWNLNDFFNYYVSKGKPEYLKLNEFIIQNELNLTLALTLLYPSVKSLAHDFRAGLFQYPQDLTYLQDTYYKLVTIQEKVSNYYTGKKDFIKSHTFIKSVLGFLNYADINFESFLKKLEEQFSKFRKCSSYSDYMRMFISIYNYRNHNPITYNN